MTFGRKEKGTEKIEELNELRSQQAPPLPQTYLAQLEKLRGEKTAQLEALAITVDEIEHEILWLRQHPTAEQHLRSILGRFS